MGTDTKLLSVSEVRGRVVSRIFDLDLDEGVDCEVWIPDESQLFNFCIDYPDGNKQLWVFDNAGNTLLSESSLWACIFNNGWGVPTLGISLPSGGLHWVWFEDIHSFPAGHDRAQVDAHGVVLLAQLRKTVKVNIENVEMDAQTVWLPTAYHSRIKELASSKRPFSVSFLDHQFIQFIDREIGYQDLRDKFTIQLDFLRTTVQLFDGDYRELSPWKSWK